MFRFCFCSSRCLLLACIQMPSLFIDRVFVYLRIGCNIHWIHRIHFGKTLCVHFVLSFVQWMIDCRTNWVNRAIDTFQQLCNCVINLNFSHTSPVNYASWSVPLVDKMWMVMWLQHRIDIFLLNFFMLSVCQALYTKRVLCRVCFAGVGGLNYF